MKKHLALVASTALILSMSSIGAGCGDDTGGSGGNGGASSSTGTGMGGSSSSGMGGGVPAPPTLGATQIDRMGRPAINTALTHPFDGDSTAKGMAKDVYNGQKEPGGWGTANAAEFAKNLAIFDALDATCGNQLLAGEMPVAGRYGVLAGALADDRLYLKTDATNCSIYLAVEANATGLIPNGDCGGRKLDYDVIDTTYSAVAVGATGLSPPAVTDNVPADADTGIEVFPYLVGPH